MKSPDNAHGFLAGKSLMVFGAGYVGGAVARVAHLAGAEVSALNRNAQKAAALRADGISVVEADLASDEWHGTLAPRFDFVLNAVSSGGGGVDGYRRSYYDGMKSILRWGQQRPTQRSIGCGHLIYTGSTSVYPQGGGVQVDETFAVGSGDARTAVLVDTEARVRDWSGATTVLRLAGIYGPGRHYLLDSLREGTRVVAGQADVHLNLIHRDDIVTAILAAFGARDLAAGRIFNVADDGRATKGEVVNWLAERLGVSCPGFSGVGAPGRRVVTPDRIILNQLIRSTLGWTPRYPTFREGYADLLEA